VGGGRGGLGVIQAAVEGVCVSADDAGYGDGGACGESAVVGLAPIKRYWSGQLTPREVVELCRRYQVGQLLLKPDPGVEWMDLLPEYEAAYKSPARVLFVRKRGGSSE
jgi:hypothetical protein